MNFGRRILLRGLGGAVVAAPFLSSLFARSARAQAQTPRRTIVMFTHYGCITNKWFPKKLDGELTADDLSPTTLAPLAPFAKKLLMPRGIRTMNEWTAQNTGAGHGRGQGVDIHLQLVASEFTCQPVTPNSNDPFRFSDAKQAPPKAMGPSLDHVMAQQLSPEGTPMLLNTAGQVRENQASAISYRAAEEIFPALTASQAYNYLTGLFAPSMAMNADTWEMSKGKLLADIVRSDLDALMRQDMSQADKQKLAAWLELSNQIGVAIAAQCSQERAMLLGASNRVQSGSSGSDDALTRAVTATLDNADVYSAIAVLAAACNANPVIFLKYPANFVFRGLGLATEAGALSHRLTDESLQGTCAPHVIDDLLKIDAYYAQKFGNLVKMLDGIAEGGGTLLDNCAAVWMSECSDGAAHNLNNAPIIQAGGCGGYFKTGRIVHLDPTSGATEEDMLGRSLAQCTADTTDMANGVTQATGTDPRFGNAPVNKYFCNLMNAMGLRADAEGYPAKDGPAGEVTHYGYSDKTEDFCGGAGAVAGATIHDPGAFAALKAS
jgi:hypothetical protein